MDRFNQKRKIIENKLIFVREYYADDDKRGQKTLRRMTRAALKKELPQVKSEGTPINEVLDDYYNMGN